MQLFVGDDWLRTITMRRCWYAAGRVLAKKRLPEGVAGMARLHELIGQQLGEHAEDAEVVIGTRRAAGSPRLRSRSSILVVNSVSCGEPEFEACQVAGSLPVQGCAVPVGV